MVLPSNGHFSTFTAKSKVTDKKNKSIKTKTDSSINTRKNYDTTTVQELPYFETTMEIRFITDEDVELINCPKEVTDEALEEFIYFLKWGTGRWNRLSKFKNKIYSKKALDDMLNAANTFKCDDFKNEVMVKMGNADPSELSRGRLKRGLENFYWQFRSDFPFKLSRPKAGEGKARDQENTEINNEYKKFVAKKENVQKYHVDLSDVHIRCEPSKRETNYPSGIVKAHSYVLNRFSKYFRQLLQQITPENGIYHCKFDIDIYTMECILYYLYSDRIEYDQYTIIPMLVAANEFELTALQTKLEQLVVNLLRNEELSHTTMDILASIAKKLQLNKLKAALNN